LRNGIGGYGLGVFRIKELEKAVESRKTRIDSRIRSSTPT